ncbi:MAG: hypothetical protein IRZ09_01070 [Variibacter sp.]|nr:hypothetical protein [Variibacter sp.]
MLGHDAALVAAAVSPLTDLADTVVGDVVALDVLSPLEVGDFVAPLSADSAEADLPLDVGDILPADLSGDAGVLALLPQEEAVDTAPTGDLLGVHLPTPLDGGLFASLLH